jgi:hypothetical protein
MFMGDFMQLPLVNDLPFYSSNIQPMFSFIKQTKKMIGKNLWDNYMCLNNIILTQQMRQVKDV